MFRFAAAGLGGVLVGATYLRPPRSFRQASVVRCRAFETLSPRSSTSVIAVSSRSLSPECWTRVGVVEHDALKHVAVEKDWHKESEQSRRMAIAQINANDPLEDRAVLQKVQLKNGEPIEVAAVIDGHGGWQVAEFVHHKLTAFLEAALNDALVQRGSVAESKLMPLTEAELQAAAVTAFERLDAEVESRIHKAFELGVSRVARIGACCVAVIATQRYVAVANCGDCRAVLGDAKGRATPLSRPHCADDPAEQAMLRRQHPGESDIVQCKQVAVEPRTPEHLWERGLFLVGLLGSTLRERACYVKGRLQPTRSFGDFHLKKPEYGFDAENRKFFLKRAGILSYPYITATPEVRVIERPRTGFVLLGSDGVWDFLSASEAVQAALGSSDTPQHEADAVLNKVMEKAATAVGLTLEQIAALPATQKRRVHDDTTVVILHL